MKTTFDLTKLDRQMMKDLDQLPAGKNGEKGVVWMRDDYLSMRGMAFAGDRETWQLLEDVSILKEDLKLEGYEFNCDKWYEGEK